MERHGKTAAGTERYRCPACRKTSVIHREDTRRRHLHNHFVAWLTGKRTLQEIADGEGLSLSGLGKQFKPLFGENETPEVPPGYHPRILVVDGKYIHGNALCVLVSVDEEDRILFRFAPSETYSAWLLFLSPFPAPTVIVMDGQKGLRYVAKRLWPEAKLQRCHFHVVQQGIMHLTRNPKEEAGSELLRLLYQLKYAKTISMRDRWLMLFRIWEHQYAKTLLAKNEGGRFLHPRVRAARRMVRSALPHLFTYLDYPDCPNTTNLAEGWVNTALAEGLRRHRGLRLRQKRTLMSVILSDLTRPTKEKPTRKYN